MSSPRSLKRCPWPDPDDTLMTRYHDREWGVPVHNDKKIFEFLVLESFQAGLSWRIILNKRENFRKAFKNFDYKKIALFSAKDRARLMRDVGIVRNRAKIKAAILNAKLFQEVQKEFGSFSKYMWSWVGGRPIVHKVRTLKDYPVVIPEAEIWAKDMKRRGFKFLGPTVVYAHMQAVGMVNDHTLGCFRHKPLALKRISGAPASKIPLDTLTAYRRTRYKVKALPSPFVLKLDQASPELRDLMRLEGVSSAAFLTAFNPGSRKTGERANESAQKDLEDKIGRMGFSFLPGAGEDPTGEWKEEPSFLVLGLSLKSAKDLGKKFRQNALVWAGVDAVPRLVLLR